MGDIPDGHCRVQYEVDIQSEEFDLEGKQAINPVADAKTALDYMQTAYPVLDVFYQDGSVVRVDLEPDPPTTELIEPPRRDRPAAWDEVPGYPRSDWQYEVANGDTILGYHEWAAEQKELDDEEEQSSDKSLRVIIAGSRDEVTYQHVEEAVKLSGFDIATVVSGTARGTDRLGESYAYTHKLRLDRYPAEWGKYGKSAGYRRNVVMANNADALIAVLKPGGSKGTQHMIDIARDKGLPTYIYRVGEKNEPITSL